MRINEAETSIKEFYIHTHVIIESTEVILDFQSALTEYYRETSVNYWYEKNCATNIARSEEDFMHAKIEGIDGLSTEVIQLKT